MNGLEVLPQTEASSTAPPVSSPAKLEHRRPFLRSIGDSLISLVIVIILVRGFLVEGYLISTGSMAPHLYGEHKQVTCPSCGGTFAVGTEFDDSAGESGHDHATCPNCLHDDIDLATRPVERGDHLLVWKNAFVWREPRRWEVVVFQNPNRPRETFIKRVAGLPEETLQIVDGNLFVDGQLMRKPFEQQRPSLLPVFDTRFAPADDEWSPRWIPRDDGGTWSLDTKTITARPADADAWTWIDYRHTRRHGGTHVTTVALTRPLSEDQKRAFASRDGEFPYRPAIRFPGVRYDADRHALNCIGVMSPTTMHRLLSIDPTEDFVAAVEQLASDSRIAPIDDMIAYNAVSSLREHHLSDELFVTVDVTGWMPESEIAIALRIDDEEYVCRCHPAKGELELVRSGKGEPLRASKIDLAEGDSFRLEFSTVDRQLSIAVNGQESFEAVPLADRRQAGDVSSGPVSIGVRGGEMACGRFAIERDIFYTAGGAQHAVDTPFRLGADEFFVLGDNSPVSSDSRGWHLAAVPRKLLVGKPFLVHLPSRTAEFHWGDRPIRLRIPDVSRMRFVR